MKVTGERFHPSMGGAIPLEHVHRYQLAESFVKDLQVLDVASGEGYGSLMLSQCAKHVTGVDISDEAVQYAQKKYQRENLEFLCSSCVELPLETDSIDVVVSFETIEHHDLHREMMSELRRVLKPDGTLIISSPDKLQYSDNRGYSNPYHVKELYKEEFCELLAQHFDYVTMLGQRVVLGSFIENETDSSGMDFYKLSDHSPLKSEGLNAHFNIAVCSNTAGLNPMGGLLELQGDIDLLIESRHLLEAEKENASAQVSYRDEAIEELKVQLDNEKKNASAQVSYRDEVIEELKVQLDAEKKNASAQISYRDELIKELEALLEAKKKS